MKVNNKLGLVFDIIKVLLILIGCYLIVHVVSHPQESMDTVVESISSVKEVFSGSTSSDSVAVADTIKQESHVIVPIDSVKPNDPIIKEAKNVVPIDIVDNCIYMTIDVNGIPMRMMFDTGCSTTRMTYIEYFFLKRQGKISEKNFVSNGSIIVANGQSEDVKLYKIDSVKVGNVVLNDVECIFSKIDSTYVDVNRTPLLIGQSIISKLGKVSIDYTDKKLIIN